MGYKVKKKDIEQSLKKNMGLVSGVAKDLNVQRQTVYNYLDKYPELKDIQKEARDKTTDVAKNRIMNAINKGHLQTCRWWLAKFDPDFADKVDLNHSGNMTHEVNHNIGEVQKAIDLIPDDVLRELLNGDERSGSKGNRKKKSGTK